MRHPRACTMASLGAPHVTYLAFQGKDSSVALEVGRSAYSLHKFSPAAQITVLTDSHAIARQLPTYNVSVISMDATRERFARFGLTKFSHHSGLGGYSKILVAELLPEHVKATIVLDSDTLVVSDIARLWNLRQRLFAAKSGGGALLAAKRLSTGGACFKGLRINSGVLLLDVDQMRKTNWTSTLLERVAWLGRGNVPARQCGKLVRNRSTLAAGDQELLSYGCLRAARGTCAALPDAMHQDRCDGISGGDRAVILHFNCRARLPDDCPSSGPCQSLVREFNQLVQGRVGTR